MLCWFFFKMFFKWVFYKLRQFLREYTHPSRLWEESKELYSKLPWGARKRNTSPWHEQAGAVVGYMKVRQVPFFQGCLLWRVNKQAGSSAPVIFCGNIAEVFHFFSDDLLFINCHLPLWLNNLVLTLTTDSTSDLGIAHLQRVEVSVCRGVPVPVKNCSFSFLSLIVYIIYPIRCK